MRPNEGPRPATRTARERLDRVRDALRAAPTPVKVVLVAAVLVLVVTVPFLKVRFADLIVVIPLLYGPYAVWRGRTFLLASVGVGLWGIAVVTAVAVKLQGSGSADFVPFLLLLVAVVAAAHAPVLARRFVPCRTVAWVLAWSVPPGMIAWWAATKTPAIGYFVAWVFAAAVLAWRLAKAWQGNRADTRQQARAAALAAPYGSGPTAGRAGNGSDTARTVRAAEGVRGQVATLTPRERPAASGDLPAITVEQAMAELDGMIGLEPVKDQIRQLTASVEAARRRAQAGFQTEKPMQHFVFLGPPGTGKTSVARIIAKIYYAFGLLELPTVLEAQRADLVGEYLGATAIKTNELIDSALGGVLFIDEAYSLVNEGDGQNDRFGNEAVQALLKRAEDDRDRLVIILAGYERQMEAFLASNPGLTSRFAIRIKFGGYSPAELLQLADLSVARRGEMVDPQARSVLWRMFEEVGRRRLGDDLGNGRFVRSLLERAGQARDVRVMGTDAEPGPADLITLRSSDLEQAYAELTSRYRGYDETPTLESALAELDALIGLEPVKRQVHEI